MLKGPEKVNNPSYKLDRSGEYPKTDYVGKTFGRLKILRWEGKNKWRGNVWLCSCQCGKQTTVVQSSLKRGLTESCGCLNLENHTKHGYASRKEGYHRLYKIFHTMKQRCYNKNNDRYNIYGGRGIGICKEWLNSSKVFIEWGLENGYKSGLTIDRIDNNKGYSPDNCRFVTPIEQSNNIRTNKWVTYKDKTQTLAQWARDLGINYSTLVGRFLQGWETEDALFRPVKQLTKKNV